MGDQNADTDNEIESTDNGSPALEHPSYAELEEKLTLAEQTAHENWEKAVRALAELDNVRRRSDREITQVRQYALEKFAADLLPITDSLEKALQNLPQEDVMQEGVVLIQKLFIDVLKKYGIEAINPEGEPFDPQCHEAISMLISPEVQANHILTVVQKGYTLNGRVIRPARVIVSKGTT